MAFKRHVWGAGKLLVVGGALVLTYVLFAAIGMRLALKSREVEVPTLIGRTVNEASTLLTETGLALKVEEGQRIDPKIPAGQVVAQEPQGGTSTRSERSVRVWVSAGPRATELPALVGESERTADLRLKQQGIRLAATSVVRSADHPAGTVIAQTPPPKSNAGEVALLINQGERGVTYVMPDLIGVNGDRAADVLRSRGFRVAVVGDHPYPGIPSGIVIRQSPQAGFQISPGETISLETSR